MSVKIDIYEYLCYNLCLVNKGRLSRKNCILGSKYYLGILGRWRCLSKITDNFNKSSLCLKENLFENRYLFYKLPPFQVLHQQSSRGGSVRYNNNNIFPSSKIILLQIEFLYVTWSSNFFYARGGLNEN